LKENTKLPLYEIAKEIEQKIMGGQISAEAAPNQRFMYSNKMCGFTLPLHLSSSMITELAPFILLLKAGKGKGGIVFEEPEAHLHLSAQRILARGIVRLVNVGVPVVITTHSDTFLQQINNMIHLHSHSNREQEMKRLGYNENEILDPDSVRGYEFIDDGGGTIVTELEKRREGLVVQSLNDPLFSLAQETLELQKDDVAETEKN
jgi:predicted ATPase